MADNDLDVRQLRKPDKHPMIFASYAALPTGGSFVLVNNHDPKHLRAEFDTEHPGSYGWEYLEKGPDVWRIRISKLTTTPLPRILADTNDTAAQTGVTGAVWKLEVRDRDLDSNIVALPHDGGIGMHTGPDLDVLIHVLSGSGRLSTEEGTINLHPGALLWLPRRSRRQFTAGPEGLRYLTVHQRRQALALEPAVPRGS
ncbi:cupin domain protein [Mycobacterium kansasii 732]|uniref:DUF2249 domain-containing protein n=1 Tax=Mycobacterium pseudokansasii TaxID=2341080 RepID=A0A498QS43_9MYCO|nr:DUF2249 domain-containing protein [Mycobacterium pseudokansasii]EUA09463.1 cupin domain protein [Mycobacterium kansasii 732]KZS69716.1 hypothetical protein A4G27_24675 [Mycobacterium kansasii]MBY0390675.1 DUF2249 domain-containing protein [Mycobacterium pseudokansasii]VAZ93512.1 hypothetical protein LAUMK35_02340 [Mycobacterium pseudokansasii]VAZ94543.1 hypothetical protein LAUMK21_02340 [Mycobacterium pseudokansasii]